MKYLYHIHATMPKANAEFSGTLERNALVADKEDYQELQVDLAAYLRQQGTNVDSYRDVFIKSLTLISNEVPA